jgi:hypothetical protein
VSEERTYRINIFKNFTDNVVEDYGDLTWPELTDFFSKHRVVEDKNDKMFNCCIFKDQTDDYAPAERDVYDGDIIIGRVIKLDNNKKPHIGKLATNVLGYSCLVFDYDGAGHTIEKVIERFIDFRHIGYTSFNHKIKGVDKFRIILPLSTDIPIEEYNKRRKSILELANTDDQSTVYIARSFYMPTCPPQGEKYAETWFNDGYQIEWEELEVEEQKPAVIFKPPRDLYVGDRGKVIYWTFDIVRFMKDQGLYLTSKGSGKHNVICPQYHIHTNADKSGTVIYERKQDGEWPSFKCAHSSCKDFKFFEYFKTQYKKGWMSDYCMRIPPLSINTIINNAKGVIK